MKLKIGGIYTFKSWEQMKNEYELNNGDIIFPTSDWCFIRNMKYLCKKMFKIEEIRHGQDDYMREIKGKYFNDELRTWCNIRYGIAKEMLIEYSINKRIE